MSDAAARMRAHRNRQRQGLVVLQIETDEAELVAALQEAGLIDPMGEPTRADLEDAVERLLGLLRVTPPPSSPC